MNHFVNRIVQLAVGLLAVLLVLMGLALLLGRGDDPYQALTAYTSYAPGNPVPDHVTCRWIWEYSGDYGEMCPLNDVSYCQQGYVIVRNNTITYLRLYECSLPAAYLVAGFGRFQRAASYRRRVILAWDDLVAQGRRVAWFTLMQPITSLGWWQERP